MVLQLWEMRQLLSINGPFSLIYASVGRLVGEAQRSVPPPNASEFLELTENCASLYWKRIGALCENATGHEIIRIHGLMSSR